ncbi:DinB family protein [Niabella beijingensis]|uniref:DinB family protein n=1 Tax=Niabella beijingensis TaxID=2872700 RepID=UPI001CBC505E|nr:DinB family protein [Niabella beijingensis]MBZ4189187.1 DinB family protein [Niabella beijingensis]
MKHNAAGSNPALAGMLARVSRLGIVLVIALVIFYPATVTAQNITNEDIKAQFIQDWERAKTYTLEYLNTMPADKYSLKPVDSIRSFARQMLHLASDNVLLTAKALEQPLLFGKRDLEQSSTAQTKDSVVYYVTASYDFVIDGLKKLDAGKLGEQVSLFNMNVSRAGWIAKTFEHQTHHRGQTTIYIRLAGIKPPEERLF